MKTLIHGGDVVAYREGTHRLLRGGDVVLDGDRIAFVGRRSTGGVDHRIDAQGRLVMPGRVNIHCHADTEARGRLIADAGRRDFLHTGFLNYQTAREKVPGLAARYNRALGGRFAPLGSVVRRGPAAVPCSSASSTGRPVLGPLRGGLSAAQRPKTVARMWGRFEAFTPKRTRRSP